MYFNPNYLPKADVVFTVMFLGKELCEKTLHTIIGEEIELIDIVSEAKNNLQQAALNSIYFDIKTQAIDGRIITLDLQRKYSKDRIRNRTIYYACREIGAQEVKRGEYENLKNVIVTFVLTEAPLIHTKDNNKIQLHSCITGEVYSDLLTIYEVNIKHIDNENSIDLQILRSFFEIESQYDFDKFIDEFGQSYLGKLLIDNYIKAVNNPSLLDILKRSDKFMIKLTDEERMEIKEKGIQEGIQKGIQEGIQKGIQEGIQEGIQKGIQEGIQKTAQNMLQDGFSKDFVAKYTGLSLEDISRLL